jgi:NADH-quinone oxidoreductase subunit L
MMGPGVAAFLAGTGAAMVVYLNQRGRPEEQFKRAVPGLYSLIYDKWRIDELYDATVIGMVDALADIFTIADKWIIDGVIAKLSAATVGALGTVLRMFQTGRVQVYAAAMSVGLVGVGWFLVAPHAEARVDDTNIRATGDVVISASNGFGYTYRWEGIGPADQKEFGSMREVRFNVGPGEKKDVKLHVRNAFAQEATQTIPLVRPGRGLGVQNINAPNAPAPGTVIPQDKIHELINPRGHQ